MRPRIWIQVRINGYNLDDKSFRFIKMEIYDGAVIGSSVDSAKEYTVSTHVYV